MVNFAFLSTILLAFVLYFLLKWRFYRSAFAVFAVFFIVLGLGLFSFTEVTTKTDQARLVQDTVTFDRHQEDSGEKFQYVEQTYTDRMEQRHNQLRDSSEELFEEIYQGPKQ